MITWGIFLGATALGIVCVFDALNSKWKTTKSPYRIDKSNDGHASKREIVLSFISFIIMIGVGFLTGVMANTGYSQIYYDYHEWGLIYLVCSALLALLVHDIYFYFTHRLLHHKSMFRLVHNWHHRSHKPTAWSTFSFHPLEGAIQMGVFPLIAIILPIHIYALAFVAVFLLFMSVYGHCGFELRPNKHKIFQVFNTSIHHYQHHTFVHYNYGIYLNLWDKLFSTNHPTYLAEVKAMDAQVSITSTTNGDQAIAGSASQTGAPVVTRDTSTLQKGQGLREPS